tara:strand:- start:155 stop:1159 length:1005 start_codon:yes stop_codon:yes gene_type:complete
MANIGNLVDRTFREYLEPMDDIVSYTTLSTGINDSATTVVFNGDLLSVEEEDALDAGAIIEIGQELMICTDLNAVTNTITVTRAARGTTAATHTAGDLIKIAPPFPRKVVFDAVKDQINNLFPTLFAVETQSVQSSNGYTLLGTYDSPGTNNYLVSVLKAISQFTDFSSGADQTGVVFNSVSVQMIQLPNPFTYVDDTSTERTITYTSGPNQVNALQFFNIDQGHTCYITFKKKFIEPTAETDTLATIGLEDEYEPIIMAGVAAQMMSGRDIPTATADYISDQLAVSNFPVGSANSIRNSLLQYQQLLITQARKYLRAKYPEAVEINGVNAGVQ